MAAQSAPASSSQSPATDRDYSRLEAFPGSETSSSDAHISVPRDDGRTQPLSHSNSLSLGRRSLSIRSTVSAKDGKGASAQRRALGHERAATTIGHDRYDRQQRQSSGGSTRSNSDAHLRRKKNLVTKMEGWWNAVKSNFSNEQTTSASARHAAYPEPRAPSAPQSRRGSDKSVLGQSLMPPAPVRRASSSSGRSIRPATSHVELRSPASQPSDALVYDKDSSKLTALASGVTQPPPALSKEGDIGQVERHSATARPRLEARRNQPSLRLDLDSTTLLPNPSHRRASSYATASSDSQGFSSQSGSGAQPPVLGDFASSSYGFGATGFASGISRWDSTPSPDVTPHVAASSSKGNKPVAPGADLTVASVRQHVKQRLNAAKEQCDQTLRRIIGIMTVYEDQRISAASDYVEEPRQDYFDTFSDSPVLDAADSEDDNAIPTFGSCKSLFGA